MKRLTSLVLAASLAAAACSESTAPNPSATPQFASAAANRTGRFVILATSETSLPQDLEARVAAAGGTLVKSLPQLGAAIATSTDPSFRAKAAKIGGIASVTEDLVLQWQNPTQRTVELTPAVSSLADNEPFYVFQWAPAAVHAPEAWNSGAQGAGARVAILDGGLYNNHIDLKDNIDVARSVSFVPGFPYNADTGTFWHGTHVAGIVAAEDNGIGVIGIAPKATIIGVKVLHNGTGSFEWLGDAIAYAATPLIAGGAGANIINMSLGALVENYKDKEIKAEIRELSKFVDRATTYAWKQGVTVIVAAGNDATDLDAANLSIPAQNAHVISVAATGPLAWAYGATNFSRQASYTNFGKRGVTLAAPGGDDVYPGNENCTISGVTIPCWAFDMYLSTSRGTGVNGGFTWADGTSMAAPVVSGIAALIVGKYGPLSPAQIQARLQQGALDLGKPGNDAVYGGGFVDAFGALQ